MLHALEWARYLLVVGIQVSCMAFNIPRSRGKQQRGYLDPFALTWKRFRIPVLILANGLPFELGSTLMGVHVCTARRDQLRLEPQANCAPGTHA